MMCGILTLRRSRSCRNYVRDPLDVHGDMGPHMRPRLLRVTFVFAAVILLGQSVYAASYCLEPDFPRGLAGAEMVFRGKITKVEQVQASSVPPGTYFVTFKVENLWKGKPADEVRVVWRSRSIADCPDLPVGDVGEDYLVYADPSRSTTRDRFPEVTAFNRTSRLPANRKPESYLNDDWGKQPRLSPKPDLNRADASNDVELLRVLRACGCLSTRVSEPETIPVCQSCLR
jgi:hypothetical protein